MEGVLAHARGAKFSDLRERLVVIGNEEAMSRKLFAPKSSSLLLSCSPSEKTQDALRWIAAMRDAVDADCVETLRTSGRAQPMGGGAESTNDSNTHQGVPPATDEVSTSTRDVSSKWVRCDAGLERRASALTRLDMTL